MGTLSAGWAHHADFGASDYHVWPLNDLIVHDTTSEDCACGPTVEVFDIRESGSIARTIVHHSLDGREAHE